MVTLKKIIILLISCLTLVCCTVNDSIEKNQKEYIKEIKVLGQDTILNIIKHDTLLYSYVMKNNRPNGLFQSYIHGKVFSKGIMVDSMKTNVWKYYNPYTSELDSVSHHFNNNKIFTLDKNDFNFKTVKMSLSEVEISIPSNWTVKENYEGMVFAIVKKEKDNGFSSNITLMLEKGSPLDFDSYCLSATSLLIKQFSDTKIIEKKEVQIDGYKAYQVIFMGVNSNHALGDLLLIINHPNGYYVYIAGADNNENSSFLKYKGLFEEILYSTKFPLRKL